MSRLLRRLPLLMVMVSALLLGEVVYAEYGSNVLASRRAAGIRADLRQEWDVLSAPASSALGGVRRSSKGFALLYVPRLRETAWGVPVLGGTSDRELRSGVGHHEDSALPGQDGNMVFSGHRTSHGRPFDGIEKLRVGDKVYVETSDAWYVYTLVDDAIVKPDALWVKRTTPTPALEGVDRVLTLVTCTPKGSVSKRWVWWGALTEVRAKSDPPAEIGSFRN